MLLIFGDCSMILQRNLWQNLFSLNIHNVHIHFIQGIETVLCFECSKCVTKIGIQLNENSLAIGVQFARYGSMTHL